MFTKANPQKWNVFLLDLAEDGEGADTARIARENGICNPDKILEAFTGFVVANKMKSLQRFQMECCRDLTENGYI